MIPLSHISLMLLVSKSACLLSTNQDVPPIVIVLRDSKLQLLHGQPPSYGFVRELTS